MSNLPRLLSRARSRAKGSVLVAVIIVSSILWMAITYSIASMSATRRVVVQRVEHDRALMVAQAGLAQGIEWLSVQGTPPTTDTTMAAGNINNPEAANYDIDIKLFPQTGGAGLYWTVVSTATYKGTRTADRGFSRRVQATVGQENFARFEQFTDYGDVWTSGYLHFTGFETVFFGPYHINSGVGLWPNLWFCESASSSATSGVRYFANYNAYVSGVYNKADAINYVNIMKYYNTTYKHEPKFYKGLSIRPKITLPGELGTDFRAKELRDKAGLTLPTSLASYIDPDTSLPFYDSSKGKKFVIEAKNPSNSNGDGILEIRQYRGKNAQNQPIYGPTVTKSISDINGAMIVYGDIESFKGVIDGRLTVGAFKTGTNSSDGNIKIDGDLEYESRKANTNFKYSDAPDLYTNNGADVNLSFVQGLKDQVYALDDICGIVAEKEVIIPRYDLGGTAVGNTTSDPLYLDCIVMATGSSTSSLTDGSFYPEDMLNRPTGKANRVGGLIQSRAKSWALFSGGTHTAGLDGPSIWDFRAIQPGGAPPFFPTTGSNEYLPNSWRDTFVASASTTPTLPTVQ
jgi:hypothetical protein